MNIRSPLFALLCALVLAVGAALLAVPAALADSPGASDTSAPHYYVALGDSLAVGDQPNGGLGHGYADQLYTALKANDPTLALVNLGCGGESTISMIYGSQDPAVASSCGPPLFYRTRYPVGGTQLSQAVSFLQAHQSFVRLVTIDIGGDDLGPCLAVLDFSDSCLNAYLPGIAGNLAAILAQLRAASGPNVPIVGMNYYDPFLGLWAFGLPGAATDSESFTVQLNDALEGAYRTADDPVANVEGAFAVTDFSDSVTLTGFGAVPLNVYNACTLTWFCTLGDIHPNDAGYDLIAQAFEAALQ